MLTFFSKDDEARIVQAIQDAEHNTSGEIRVHLEKKLEEDVLVEAQRVFTKLGMHQTAERNGVLIFIAPQHRKFAIIGDEGINQLVGEDFWAAERDIIQQHFRQGAYAEGICKAIEQVGEKLKAHFPYQTDDTNELSDEISYSD
ncbi:MAG: TPM domain-containing protein [Saprospiraceae bacterium]